MKNFLQVNRALVAEKNIYLNLNQLPSKNDGGQSCDGNRQSRLMSQSGCSVVDVPMTSYGAPDEHPMSIRSASDGERWNSRGWKYVAMIFAVLVMSVANIGMAWGATKTITFSGPTSTCSAGDNITLSATTNITESVTLSTGISFTNSGYALSATSGDNKSCTYSSTSYKIPQLYTTGGTKANWNLAGAISQYVDITLPAGSSFTLSSIAWALDAQSTAFTAYIGVSGGLISYESAGLSVSNSTGATSNTLSSLNQSWVGGTTYRLYVQTTGPANTGKYFGICKLVLTGEYSAPAASEWQVKGLDDDKWAGFNMTGTGTVTCSRSLSANTEYTFKLYNTSTSKWWGNGTTYKMTQGQTIVQADAGANCKLRTSKAGTYTFSFNTSTNELTVTYPDDYKGYWTKNGASWSKVYAYCYNDGTWKNADWPGVEITSQTEDICGTHYYINTSGYTTVIFNNGGSGSGNQTENIAISGGEGKHAVGAAATAFEAFPTYTITFAANGGSSSMSNISSIACGSDQKITANGYGAPSGYQFAGWKANVAVTIDDETVSAGTIIADQATLQNISSDITLTAQWELIPTYDVTYHANLDGTSGSTSGLSDKNSGFTFNVAANGFSKTGYKFKWWHTAANGTSGVDYYAGEPDTVKSADINLYAQWESVESNEEYWVGSPFTWTSSKITVGDMVITPESTSDVDLNGTLTANTSSTIVNKQSGLTRHAKVMALKNSDKYLQIHFSDGKPINKLYLGSTTNSTDNKKVVVVYSATSDFTTAGGAAHEFVTVGETSNTVTLAGYNQATKAVTDVSPSLENTYYYARIYKKITSANTVFDNTANLGDGATMRIYSIKAKKGATCTAPSTVTVAPTKANGYRYTPGETISLTCTASGGSGGDYSYQWQKYYDGDWHDIADATSAVYSKSNCTTSDGGSYRCIVSTGEGCETISDGGDGYKIRVWTFNGNYSGEDWIPNNITWTGANTGTVTLTLNANSTYKFKVYDNDNKYFGCNSGMTKDESNWTFYTHHGDASVSTGKVAGEYTFTIDITNVSDNNISVSVVYPKMRIYMVCGDTWCDADPAFFVHSWKNTTTNDAKMIAHPCEDGVYYADLPSFVTEMTILRLKTGTESVVWEADPNFLNRSSNITIGSNDKFTFSSWNTGVTPSQGTFTAGTYSPTTYTVSAAASTAGYGTVSAASVTGVACGTSISASTNTLTVGATSVTATATESDAQYTYAFTNWTWTPAGSTVTSDVTATANFTRTLNSYTVTWKNGATTLETDASVNYGATPSYDGSTPTKDADALYTYTFSGWSPAIGTVTGDATYSAQFTAIPKTVAYGDATIYAYNDSKRVVSGTRKTAMETTMAGSNGETAISGSLPLLHSIDGLTSVVLAGQCKSEVKTSFPWLGSYIKMKTDATTATITFNVASGYAGTATIYFSAYSSDKAATLTNGANSASITSDKKSVETEGNQTSKNIALVSGANTLTISGNNGYISRIDVALEASCTSVAAPTGLNCSGHTSETLTFSWTKADRASGYVAKLWTNSECSGEAVKTQNLSDVNTVTFNTLTANTTYYCKVQSKGDGSTYCAAGGTTSAQSGTTDAACTAHGLAYASTSVEKNVGDAAFTNTLTNPHSLVVTYSSSNTSAATVNPTSGMVTIVGAGETTITATWAGDATYCSGTATYTLTVSSGCTPQSIVKTQLTSTTAGTTTGYNDGEYADDPVIASFQKDPIDGGYKMTGSAKLFVTLKKGNFVAGDKINIVITKASDLTNTTGKLLIFYNASTPTLLKTIDAASAGTYTYTLTDDDITTLGYNKTIGVFRSSGTTENNPYVKSVEVAGCREWATCEAPDAIAVGSVTATGATFTITDAENTNNYEIYYSTSSTAPTAETSAIVSGISSKSRAVTGLTAETTYYYWVRSNCGGATKSSWVAGTPASFTTSAAAATHNVTYNGNGSTDGSVPTDDTDYEEGDVVTVKGNTGSLVKTGQTFLGWSTSSTASSGTFYPAGYKFYMPNEAVTLYAVWGSTAEEKYYYGSITITAGALTPGSTGTKGFFTNNGGEIATSSAISLSSTPSETGYYYESSTLTHTALNKSSNWNTSSTAKRTIRAFKFKSGDSYTLALGSKTATSIMFYGRCGSASKTMSVGGQEYESPSTKEQFFSHEFTKVGNFTSNVTITQDGDFYGILVVTISTGAASGFTVSFNMKDHGSAIADIENIPSGSKIGAPVPAPTAADYEFGGWYKDDELSDDWDFANDQVTVNTTLYAKWSNCAPTISAHPVAATYTQDAAATALSVTASGEGLNYQWYTSEEAGEDISGSSAIPGATSASYTPSTSLLGTIYYFCVVSNTCGNAISNKAAITVNDSKPAPTANWDIEEPKEGGKGFTFSIEVNKNNGDNWDGELIASMLTLSDNAILDGASIVVNNTDKTISGTYGVKAGSSSPVTFYLLLPATTTQSATRLDRDRTFTPCAGGAGDSYNVPVRKDYEKDASNNYRWVTPGAGEITYAVNSSISSAKAASRVASVFDSIMSSDKQYVWVKTYEANTKTISLYVETSGANISVNALYKNTVYATAADKDIVSSDDYTVSYDGSGSAENTGTKGTHYMDITFDSPLDANDIICIKFSSSKVKAYGAVLTTVGDGGDQTTGLTWSNDQASGATVVKQEDAVDFTITAVRDATALKSLGLISYTSSNTAIATIDGATGLVHIADNIDFGSDEFKTTTITATLAASGCYKKAVITYILKVTKYVCPDKPGTIEVTATNCSSQTLRVSGYEEGASIKWYRNGSEIPSATSAEYTATVAGEYYVVTHKTCDITSTNSINVTFATASAEKIVDQWYVKNGRRTPDIALVQTKNATSFTVTSGGTPVENIGGCTFELKKDGIIYLHGQKEEDGSAPSDMTAGDMTITITVSGCAGALSGLNITIHKQAETAKPSVAFVVDGTLRKDGGTATSVSEAKTSDRDLWKYLNNTYALTGCNVYWSVDSKELREYYSQYDAILITDDPNTQTKGTGSVPYVKAFGTMVDVRPILTMEAYVGRYSDGGWHVYNASPSSPNPRQVEMKLECKNHDIFKGLDPEASDNVRVTRDEYNNEYWHVIMVDTTVAPYHNTSKDYKDLPALQGFDKTKFSNMLGVGTIAEETLQAGVERQEEPAARMMILGIQNEAMAALTNEGKLIIKNAIEYLLKTNMEDVNDCANYFTGGPSGTGDDWATAENWSSGKVPDFESRVRILRPVVISGGTKVVARVDIATSGKSKWIDGECTGKVTINPTGALIVGGKIRRADAPHFGIDNLMPTENSDLIVRASSDGPHYQGALIHDNTDGLTHAEVEMWNPSHWEVEGGKKKKYWSYVAVPIQEADIPNFFWHGFTYLYDETSGWEKKFDGSSLYPFQGIGASLQTGNIEWFYGPLATTENQDITLTYTAGVGKGMNLIGNSWTAPIQIANFEEDDFGDAAAEVWVFNTGHEKEEGTGSGSSTTAGQWNAIPINSAGLPGYEGLKVIPAMQAFEVNTTSETTLHLDYDRLVRAGRENLNEPMRAPRRSAAKEIEATMRVRVSGELTHTDVYLLKDARFSDGFDNGWDGHYLSGDDRSAQLYAISEEEGKLAFLAQPEIEGTVLGFAPSKDGNEYTFSFSYDGDEEYYLNDLKLTSSTLISNESSYLFTYETGDTNRFYISRQPLGGPAITTGVDEVREEAKPRKFIYNDKMYILFNGRVFDATGKAVK